MRSNTALLYSPAPHRALRARRFRQRGLDSGKSPTRRVPGQPPQRGARFARWSGAVLLGACASVGPARAAPWPEWPDLATLPQDGYVQVARATRSSGAALGVAWSSSSVECFDTGYRCSLRVEAELARWRPMASVPEDRSTVSQVGFSALWRQELPRQAWHGWFVEIGTGVNRVSPHYRAGDRTFSTSFNFGTQLAAGLAFGLRRAHELSLRIEHFSNAGIREPNPGEDFVQVRYLLRH